MTYQVYHMYPTPPPLGPNPYLFHQPMPQQQPHQQGMADLQMQLLKAELEHIKLQNQIILQQQAIVLQRPPMPPNMWPRPPSQSPQYQQRPYQSYKSYRQQRTYPFKRWDSSEGDANISNPAPTQEQVSVQEKISGPEPCKEQEPAPKPTNAQQAELAPAQTRQLTPDLALFQQPALLTCVETQDPDPSGAHDSEVTVTIRSPKVQEDPSNHTRCQLAQHDKPSQKVDPHQDFLEINQPITPRQ